MPTLTIIQGPDQGRTFEIDGASSTIGRDPQCAVPLRDPGVSRNHAFIELRGDHYVLRDAGSANGTYMNGARITEVGIQPGDQIRIANTIFAVAYPPAEAPVENYQGLPIQVDTEGRVDSSIMATATASGEPHLAFAGGGDMAQMRTSIVGLRALYRIAELLARNYDIDRLLGGIMDMVFDVVDADRGFILLKDARTGAMTPKAIRYREELLDEIRREQSASAAPGSPQPPPAPPPPEKQAPICVSKTIISYVTKRGEGVLTTNAMQDQRFEQGESVQDFGIRSAICVPIKSRTGILGIMHVDTHVSQGRFSPEDLKLMTAIGCQTGLAVENALLMASQVQQERLAAVGQAVASLSHYTKNILQGIEGGSHAVESGLARKDLEPIEKGWDVIRRNLHRVNSLVLDMLSYSRQAPPNLVKTSVNAIVREVAELAQPAAHEKQVALTTQLDTTLPEVAVDPDGIHHACLNILNNAIVAVAPVTGKVEITTRLSPHQSEVWITIADNGCGIPRENQPMIFQAFYSSKGHKGTGLGLAAAEKIVEEQGGRITFNSEPGQGTAFVIHLRRK
jgi:two-component system, NtrC family, sensor kinase